MLAWCSISLSSTTSPAPRLAAPQDLASRLNDSVAFLVKTISFAPPGALMKSATRLAGALVGGGGLLGGLVDARGARWRGAARSSGSSPR